MVPRPVTAPPFYVVSEEFPPKINGEAMVTWRFVQALAESGRRLVVVTSKVDQGQEPWWRLPGVSEVRLPACPLVGSLRGRTRLARLRLADYWASWWAWEVLRWWRTTRRQEGQDVVLITRTNPASGVAIGRHLSRSENLRWVACINDPHPAFLAPPPYGPAQATGWRQRLELRSVNRSLHRAAAVVFPTRRLWDWQECHGVHTDPRRVVVIPHAGVALPFHRRSSRTVCTLTHAGTLDCFRNGRLFLSALEKVISTRPALCRHVKLRLAGHLDPSVVAFIEGSTLAGNVELLPELAWPALAQATADTNAFVVIEAELAQSVFLPAKLSDLAQSGAPLLVSAPTVGPVADVVGGASFPGFLGQELEIGAARLGAFFELFFSGAPLDRYVVSPLRGMCGRDHAAMWNHVLQVLAGSQ